MLVQFSFANYKTFKDRAVLNLVASNYDKDTLESNVIALEKQDLRLLTSNVIFGSNASGKSKFIDALTFFTQFVKESSKDRQKGEAIGVVPFRLNETTKEGNSEFEIIFMLDGLIYRYGFEANRSEIVAEWLYSRKKISESELFYRDGQTFEVDSKRLKKARALIDTGLIRNNALMLSVLAQFNDDLASAIILYFDSISCVSGLNEADYKNNSIEKVRDNPRKKEEILQLLKGADFGIEDIRYEDITSKLDEKYRKAFEEVKNTVASYDPHIFSSIRTKHKLYNDDKEIVGYTEFSMQTDESSGTQKYFYLIGLLLDALENGTPLVVDELDSKLHPNLVCKIISLFNSRATNPKNAQLIFNTHDTNLLSADLFRRDQIWFVEKNEYGESRLYSLADFKTSTVRKNESFENNYIRGKYGAIPYLNRFEEVTETLLTNDGQAK